MVVFKTHLDKLPKELFSLTDCSAKKPEFLKILVMIVFVSLTGISNIDFGNLGTTAMVPKKTVMIALVNNVRKFHLPSLGAWYYSKSNM